MAGVGKLGDIIKKDWDRWDVEGISDKELPVEVRRLYGCGKCEWRGTKLCPHGIVKWRPGMTKRPEGKGYGRSRFKHLNGICRERENYLKGFIPAGSEVVKYTVWRAFYDNEMARIVNDKDYVAMMRLDDEYQEYKVKYDVLVKAGTSTRKVLEAHEVILENKERLADKAREKWQGLWEKRRKFQESQMDREMPKRVEIDVRKRMSIEDIHSIMRGDGRDKEVEVEGKVVEEE